MRELDFVSCFDVHRRTDRGMCARQSGNGANDSAVIAYVTNEYGDHGLRAAWWPNWTRHISRPPPNSMAGSSCESTSVPRDVGDYGIRASETLESVVQILFTGDDLARVRLSSTMDSFEELRTSAHNPVGRHDPVLGGWVRDTAARLGPAAPAIVKELRSPLVQFSGMGTMPDGSISFDDQVHRALTQPTSQWRLHSAEVHWYGCPIAPDLSDGKPAAVSALGEALRTFHDAALAPHWAALSDAASAAVATWSQIMARTGVEGLFQRLHADAQWVPPVLSFDGPKMPPCPPGCGHARVWAELARSGRILVAGQEITVGRNLRVSERGLTILPSVFGRTCGVWVVVDPSRGLAAEVLTVPIPVSWELFAGRHLDHRADPLAHLLGATRSWVLRACAADEPTTSSLARTVGISVSSASEHTSALRAAGLITSHRTGNRVIHRPTPTGLALLLSSDRPSRSRRVDA